MRKPPRVAIPPVAPDAFYRRDRTAPVGRFGGETMGTTWSAHVVAPPPALADALRASLAESIAALSQWEPASALSRFNRAPVGTWVALDPILAEVLAAALAIRTASQGAFDPAGGALSELWGFGAAGRRHDMPDEQAVAVALAASGSDGIEISDAGAPSRMDPGHRGDLDSSRTGSGPARVRARRTRDVALDLSGIGKGHAVDRLAATCRAHGCADFLVEIGGEYVGAGIRPDAQPWWVELESPPLVALAPLRIAACNVAVATSGDYRRYIPAGSTRLGHTLDPRTGRPIANGVVSVSVIAADCTAADGWATALTVLGPDAGLATATRLELAARIVTQDGVERLSPALTAMLDG